jgi:hypothetical protein
LRNRRRLAVVEYREVVLFQVRHEPVVGVEHRRINRHGLNAGPEDVLLWILRRRGDDGPDQDDGRDEREPAHVPA